MAFDTLRWPSIPFDGLRYPSRSFDTLRSPSRCLRGTSNPREASRPTPTPSHTLSLDPSGPPPSSNDFELLKRQFEPFRISRLISQAPLAGPSLPALASACGPVYFTSSHAVWYIVGPLQGNPLEFSLWFSLARSVVTLLVVHSFNLWFSLASIALFSADHNVALTEENSPFWWTENRKV